MSTKINAGTLYILSKIQAIEKRLAMIQSDFDGEPVQSILFQYEKDHIHELKELLVHYGSNLSLEELKLLGDFVRDGYDGEIDLDTLFQNVN